MELRRLDKWKIDSEKYTESQITSVLLEIGIDIIGDTRTNFLCLCPFHSNDNTPALSVSRESGLFMCFNPSCGETGNLIQLVQKQTGLKHFPAIRFITKYSKISSSRVKTRSKTLAAKEEMPSFDQNAINRLYDNFWGNQDAQEYMHKRGFKDTTLEHFKIGYSERKNLIAVPMHDKRGNPVGVIGRSIEGKRFDNSRQLPTSRTLFNLHRAMRESDKVIVVEASFDAMRVYQSGFPSVVALCMGTLSPYHVEQLDMYFNTIIIATDFDDYTKYIKEDCRKCENDCKGHNPGRALGKKIADQLSHKRIKWASHSSGIIYPNQAKDLGELSDEDIAQTINNAVTNLEYNRWRKSLPELEIL